MSVVTLRLNPNLDQMLTEESKQAHLPKAKVIRKALEEYLANRERRRFYGILVAEMQSMSPEQRAEEKAFLEETIEVDNEAMEMAEDGPVPGKGVWWK